jgi:hypothetical protein
MEPVILTAKLGHNTLGSETILHFAKEVEHVLSTFKSTNMSEEITPYK